MLRKFAYNKIFRTTGMLVLLLLLLLFPASKEYKLEDEKLAKTSVSYSAREAYLIDKDGFVARCKVKLNSTSDKGMAIKLTELLINGGKYESLVPNGFKAILPSDTKINDVLIKDDTLTIDLSNDILELDNKSFKKALEALTYNLTSINNIKYVYLKIDGTMQDKYPDGKNVIKQPLERKDGVNTNYDAFDYKNASITTIYYVNKSSSGYYYVPVSKVSNDNRDKIKIIVDELTSYNTYETNLMSFLNYNTKLTGYDIKDDVLTVDFNEYLFDDANSKSILEEVIYSISLSVRDNYDVKEVIFTVNGKEITKSVLKNIE